MGNLTSAREKEEGETDRVGFREGRSHREGTFGGFPPCVTRWEALSARPVEQLRLGRAARRGRPGGKGACCLCREEQGSVHRQSKCTTRSGNRHGLTSSSAEWQKADAWDLLVPTFPDRSDVPVQYQLLLGGLLRTRWNLTFIIREFSRCSKMGITPILQRRQLSLCKI